MRSTITVAVVVLLGLAALSGVGAAQTSVEAEAETCDFPYETPDGETVVEEEPETVAPGIASVSQILWELDSQDKVVGLTSNSFYLEETEGYVDLGTTLGGGFDENVIQQNPDIVVNALFEPEGLEDTLESAGIEYHFMSQSGSFEDIQQKVNLTGRLIGECEEADEVIEEMSSTISDVENAVEGESEPLVMFGTPTEDEDNFVPGEGTFKHDVITTAGAKNVYAEVGIEGELEQIISDEKRVEALLEDPDWIVVESSSPEVPKTDLYNQTTAVQENQILPVDTNRINQDAPRIVIPLERMARAFHPNAFVGEGPVSGGGGSGSPSLDPGDGVGGTVTSLLTVADGVSVAEFSTGAVEAVEIASEVEGEVTVSTVETGDAPGLALRRVAVAVPDGASDTGGSVRMSIDGQKLDNASVPTEDLTVVGRDGGWEALETSRIETEDGVTLVAETSVFDEFAVVASTEPTPAFESTVDGPNETVTLDASASSDEYGEVVGYSWEVGNATHEGETVEVESDDSEEVTLTVKNDAGLSATTTETLELNEEESEEGTEEQGEDGSETETDDGPEEDTGEGGGTGDDTDDDGTGNGPTEEEGGEDEGEGLPGFTAIVALVAVLALVAARSRRR